MGTSSVTEGKPKTFTAGGTILPHRALKPTAAGWVHCGAGEGNLCRGFSGDEGSLQGEITVWLRNAGCSILIETSSDGIIYAPMYCAAAGVVTDVPNGEAVVELLEAASGTGSIKEGLVLPSGNSAAQAAALGALPLLTNAITAAELAAEPRLVLGMEVRSGTGGLYKLVLNDNVNGAAIGAPLGTRTAGTVSYDMSDDLGASSALACQGAAASTFASTDVVGWMLVEGDLEQEGISLATDTNVAANTGLFWGADGLFHGLAITGTPADHKFVGQAAKADAAALLVAGYINGRGAGFNQAA
jgi:hypothetical protein